MNNKAPLRIKPLIVKKGNIRILNHSIGDGSFTQDLFKEDVLYDTTDMYYLKGEFQRLLLVNRFNLVSKQSRAVAKYYSKDGSVLEKTSDKVTEVIGQDQFKTIFTALCSILDQELKIRSILALLTLKSTDKMVTEPIIPKSDGNKSLLKMFKDNSCQTDEMRIEKVKPRKRIRKPVSPYIVPDVNIEAEKQKPEKSPYIVPDGTEKKKPKRLIINVRKVNHINPETLEKVTLRSEMSVAPFYDDQEQDQDDGNRKFDPLSTGQKNFNNQIQNITFMENSSGNLSIIENETGLTIVENQIENLTDLNSCNRNLTAMEILRQNTVNSTNLDNQKQTSTGSLTDLGFLHDEYSNDSGGRFSVLSDTPTNPELLTNPVSMLNNIDQHTDIKNGYKVPGTDIVVPFKPEDIFHIATKDNLQHLDNATKKKLLRHQLSMDYDNCLNIMDDQGSLPIHLAVINNDAELLVRLCIVLKMRGSSIDIPVNGPTALSLAVDMGRGELVACLVRHGACPLRTDDNHRACLHDAAEKDPDLLRAVLAVCRQNARKILYENEDLWKAEMETQTDEELSQLLVKHMCSMFNKQGYNPLMLASMLGLYENVRILIEHSASVNDRMPTCGNTALYLAISAACNNSIELGNTSKVVDHYRKTIELLLQHGADPSIDNNYSTNVHTLLQEFNNHELSMLVANKQYLQLLNKKVAIPLQRDVGKVMLVLGKDGDISCKSLENERTKKTARLVKKQIPTKPTDKKLVIVEDVILKPGNTASAGKSKDSAKVNSNKNLKVFQIRDNEPKEKEKIIILPKNKGVKRKQSDALKTKQAKINK